MKNAPYDCNRVTKLDPQENGKNRSGEKEQIACYKFIAPNPHFKADVKWSKRYAEPVTVRVWMARSSSASVVYASVWAHGRNGQIRLAGNGSAGGGGYCKESAAIDDAFDSAGITMERNFNGCGTQCAEIAIVALAKRLGWKTGDIVKC